MGYNTNPPPDPSKLKPKVKELERLRERAQRPEWADLAVAVWEAKNELVKRREEWGKALAKAAEELTGIPFEDHGPWYEDPTETVNLWPVVPIPSDLAFSLESRLLDELHWGCGIGNIYIDVHQEPYEYDGDWDLE